MTELRELAPMQPGFFHNTIHRRLTRAARRLGPDGRAWLVAARSVKGEKVVQGPPPQEAVYSPMDRFAVLPRDKSGRVLCNVDGRPVFKQARYNKDHTVRVED